METEKVVGLWIRVSTDMQVMGDSPEHHRKNGQSYAESKKWKIGAEYLLDAVSGKSVVDHPEYKRMVADIKRGHISGLIFSKLARVARNIRELLDFADFFKEQKADMISLGETIDTSSPIGMLFYIFIAAVAQFEREETSSRVAASVPARAKLGKPLGGAATFGYKWENKRLMLDETEAPIRRLVYEIFARTKRKKTTAEELNRLGHRTRKGEFSDTTIDRLIRDTAAKGLYRANYTKSRGKKKQWDYKPADEWIFVECPPIVSVELWEECNQYLDLQHKKRVKRGRLSNYLLAGIVQCTCGRKMYVYHRTLIYVCRACKNRIEVTDIDAIYHGQLKSFLFTDRDIVTHKKQLEVLIAEKGELLTTTTDTVRRLEREMKELVTMRVQQELTPEDFTYHYQPFKDRHTELHPLLAQLQSEITVLNIQAFSSDAILQEARNLFDRWEELPMSDRRSIVETITEHVIVGHDDLTIKLAYLPSHTLPSQNNGTRQHNNRDS